MRKFFFALLAVLLFTGEAWCQQALKMGMVALEVIIQNYPRFQQVDEQLQREMTTYQKERKSWEADMDRLKAAIQKKEETLRAGQIFTDQKKIQLQQEIDSLTTDFSNRVSQKTSQEQEYFTKRRNELLAVVLEEVNEVIRQMGEERGYDLIFDASNGTVVYAREPDDLNDELLNRLKNK